MNDKPKVQHSKRARSDDQPQIDRPLLPWIRVRRMLSSLITASLPPPQQPPQIQVAPPPSSSLDPPPAELSINTDAVFPFGFQLLRVISSSPKNNFKSVVYISPAAAQSIHPTAVPDSVAISQKQPSTNSIASSKSFPAQTAPEPIGPGTRETVLTLDQKYMQVLKGRDVIIKESLSHKAAYSDRRRSRGDNNTENLAISNGVVGLEKVVVVEKYRVLIAFSSMLQLRVLDMHFSELASAACPCPILCMEFIETHNILLTGETGFIRIWQLNRSTLHHVETFTLRQLKIIHMPNSFDQWVNFIFYDADQNRIIAPCDTTLYYFDLPSATLIDKLKNAHKITITCCLLNKFLNYLTTADKCGIMRVWNTQNCLIYEFRQHIASVTSLLALKTDSGTFGPGLILSASIDRTVRMWNLEVGVCIYRFDATFPITSMTMTARSNDLLIASRHDIHLYNIERKFHQFSFTNTRAVCIKRFVRNNFKPARLLVGFVDGTVRVLSPVSGEGIVAGFPIYKDDCEIVDLEYDSENDKIFIRTANRDTIVYSTRSNPMRVLDLWEPEQTWEQINCIVGINLTPPPIIPTRRLRQHFDQEDVIKRKSGFKFTNYFLVGAAANGQLMLLAVHSKGRQEPIVQAHGAEITSLVYDDVNFYLISAAKDYRIKVWKIKSRSSLPAKEKLESHCAISLECIATITLTGVLPEAQTFEKPRLDKTLVINPYTQELAFPWFEKLRIISYSDNLKVQPFQIGDKRTDIITATACSAHYEIWATSDICGSVKILDNFGTVIREIQFNQTVSCLQFANVRGDLLVGLETQISVIYIQDYFTHSLMQAALDFSCCDSGSNGHAGQAPFPEDDINVIHDANGYSDDAEEHPLLFDSNTDFWGIFYESQEQIHHENINWHIPKLSDGAIKLTEKMEKHIATWPLRPVFDEEATQKRRNRRLFLEKETEVYNLAESFEEKYVVSKHNAAHLKENQAPPLKSQHEIEPILIENSDYIYLRRTDSVDAMLPTGLDVSTPKINREDFFKGWKSVRHSLAIGQTRMGPIVQAAVHRHKAAGIIANPNLRKRQASAATVQKHRDTVKQSLIKRQIALPNSVVKNPLDEPRKTVTAAFTPKPPTRQNLALSQNAPLRKPSPKPDWWFDEEEPEERAIPDTLSKTVRYGSAKSPASLSETLEPKAVPPKTSQDSSVTPEIISKVEDGQNNLLRPVSTGGSRRKSFADVADLAMRVREIKKVEEENIQQKKSKVKSSKQPPKTQKPEAKSPRVARTTVITKPPIVAGKLKSEPHIEKEFDQEPTEPTVDSLPYLLKGPRQPPAPASPPIVHVDISKKDTIVIPEMKESESEESIFESVDDMIVEDMNGVSSVEAEAYAWNLLRMRQGIGIPAKLDKIVEKFWYRQLEDIPVDIESVIRSLIHLMQTGEWSECCEASKALLYIYMTFKRDFPDPYYIFITPHLDVLDSNEFWQVRAQICSNLSAFRIHHRQVFQSLIMRLNDTNIVVRLTAKRALMYLDVDSRTKLLELMKRLGFFGEEHQRRRLSRLEILERKLKRQGLAAAAEAMECVKTWRETIEAIECTSTMSQQRLRQNSYNQHLAGPFFKDKQAYLKQQGYKQSNRLENNFSYAEMKEGVTAWMEARGIPTESEAPRSVPTAIQRQNALKSLTSGRPVSSKPMRPDSGVSVSTISIVAKMTRPISAGIRDSHALEYRKTNRPMSSNISLMIRENIKEAEAMRARKSRPTTATTSPYLSSIPYSQSAAFLSRKPLTRSEDDDDNFSKKAWH